MLLAGSRLAIGVYRRTWRAHLLVKASGFSQRVKEAKRKKGSEGGRPVETAAAVEIGKVAFGNFFLMIPTNCLEKPSQKPLWLSHRYHSADGYYPFRKGLQLISLQTQNSSYSRFI